MQPAATVASDRVPTEAWRDAVSTFWNTAGSIRVAVAFLPLERRLELRCVDSRWNVAVCDSVQCLKCKSDIEDAALGALVDTFREVQSLSLRECRAVTVEGLSHLARLGELTELDLSNTSSTTNNTDSALEVVVSLPRVTSLMLRRTSVTDEGATKLCAMPQLTSLDLRGCQSLTPASLERLSQALSHLTSLRINGALARPAATQHLRCFPRLTSLAAHGVGDGQRLLRVLGVVARLIGSSAVHITCLTELTALDVSHSSFFLSNVDVASLCDSLPRLTSLSVCGNPWLSDASMERVSQLSALTSLDISEVLGITLAGVVTISRLSGLKTLRLSRVCTDAWLEHVAKLTGLTELDLCCCDGISDVEVQGVGVTDGAAVARSGAPLLQDLSAHHVNITSVFVATLSQLRSLKRLDLRGCSHVSVSAAAALRVAIPGLEVLGYSTLSAAPTRAAPRSWTCVAQ